jgi:hypothetical protein
MVLFLEGGFVLSEGYEPLQWRKSSFSGDGDCVECSIDSEGVRVRDSNSNSGTELCFSHASWKAFVAVVKAEVADFSPP